MELIYYWQSLWMIFEKINKLIKLKTNNNKTKIWIDDTTKVALVLRQGLNFIWKIVHSSHHPPPKRGGGQVRILN